MSNSITAQIDRIIEERQRKLPLINTQIDRINEAKSAVERIMALKHSIFNENGELDPNSEYYSLFADSPEMTVSLNQLSSVRFMKEAEVLLEKYDELKKRFSREYVNIAVVGTARQGKSMFLQSISGLDDKCIPAFYADHCTGTGSIICNGDSDSPTAYITFKTESDIIVEVQEYLNRITDGQYRINSLNDIPKLNKEDIEKLKKDTKVGKAKAEILIDTLFNRYVKPFNEWCGLLGREPETVTSENEIMKYVAQFNADKNNTIIERYYKFVAVKQAIINRRFLYQDAGKIRMIDTEGLGVVTTNTESNMMNTINTESDGVVFLMRPAKVQKPEEQEIEIFDRIRDRFEKRQMEKWFSVLVNHTGSSSPYGDNYDFANGYYSYFDENNVLPAVLNAMVDVSDREAVVNNFLEPFLKSLSANLVELDAMYLDDTRAQAERAYAAYDAFCSSLNNIANKRFRSANSDTLWFASQKVEDTINRKLITALYHLIEQKGKNRDKPCYVLKDQIEVIVDDLMGMIPSEEEIEDLCNSYGGTPYAIIYANYLDKIRNRLTKQFIEVDTSLEQLLHEFKVQVAKCILDEDGGSLGGTVVLANEGENPYEALLRYSREKLDPDEYPQLSGAFEFIFEFEFSVRGFLMSKLRTILYPISRANPNLLSHLDFTEGEGKAQSIRYYLMIALDMIQSEMNKKEFKSFFTTPNETIFAVGDEFVDRVCYSEGAMDEWRKLYYENVSRIWGKELAQNAANSEKISQWMSNIEQIQTADRPEYFIIRQEK